MKVHSIVTLIMATILTALLALGGCVTEPAIEVTPARRACIELMQKVPVYYEGFQFWDARTLQSDPDLGEFYKVWYERRGESLEKHYGLSIVDTDYFTESEGLRILKGKLDIEGIRSRLSADFYRDTSYEDMEVWVSKPNEERATRVVVLEESLFIRGGQREIDDYLRVIRGEELSLYDKNAAEVLERLPQGIMTSISRESYPEGLIVSGSSYEKVEKGTFRWSNIYKFESPEDIKSADADKYFKGIEDGFKKAEGVYAERGEPCPLRSFTLEQEGEFVEWSVLVEEKYMIFLLFYG